MSNLFIENIQIKIDTFTEYTGRFMAWLMLLMVLLSFSVVILRYGFNYNTTSIQEGVLYLHATVFMLGAAYTLKHEAHVRVDIFYQHMSAKNKSLVDLLGVIFLLIPFNLFMFFMCFDYVMQSWTIGEQSSDPGGLAFVYVHKSLMLILPIVFILQALAQAIHHYLLLKALKSVSSKSSNKNDDSENPMTNTNQKSKK